MRRIITVMVVLSGILAAGAACASSDELTGSERVIEDYGQILVLDDFTALGLKLNKTYDVSELSPAVTAYMGFYTPSGDKPIQVELRFFHSHDEAKSDGVPLAEEVTGPDAITLRDEVTVLEGYKDRVTGQTDVVGPRPRYMAYVIFNNVIVLCEGLEPAQSVKRCAALTSQLIPPG